MWHSLVYSTGILLIVGGIPATIILTFVFMGDRAVRLDHAEALLFGGCMIGVEVVVAGILLYVAEKITWRRHRHDAPDARQIDEHGEYVRKKSKPAA
ncbi:MAG: hypothetical protein P4N59_02980 [Negativicutes bacterium]|nr:hypothetical protein [Negativicutes bacterium]